jgi:hypothetical protein
MMRRTVRIRKAESNTKDKQGETGCRKKSKENVKR